MVRCSQCGSAIDAAAQSHCPQCRAPVQVANAPADARSYVPPPKPGGVQNGPPAPPNADALPSPDHRIRVALNGEVIADEAAPRNAHAAMPPTPPQSAHPLPNLASPSATPRAGVPPIIPPVTAHSQRPPASVRASGGSGPITAVVIVAFAVLLGGGSWFAAHRKSVPVTDPKTQAERFFAAAKVMDWKTLYEVAEAPARTFPTERDYAAKMAEGVKQGFIGIAYMGMLIKPEIRVGEPDIHGDEATIPITRSETAGGEPWTHSTDLKMKKIDGVWKVADTNGYGSMVAGKFEFEYDSRKDAGLIKGGGWKVERLTPPGEMDGGNGRAAPGRFSSGQNMQPSPRPTAQTGMPEAPATDSGTPPMPAPGYQEAPPTNPGGQDNAPQTPNESGNGATTPVPEPAPGSGSGTDTTGTTGGN